MTKEELKLIPVVDEQLFKTDLERESRYEIIWDYIIDDGKEHDIAIICPGGAYGCVCSYVEGKPFAQYLNALGKSAVIVYYRVGDEARYPNPQDDLARAVKEVFKRAKELHLNVNKYSIWGSSAGGHLVASFGTDNMGYKNYDLPKPSALVLIYPVISMKDGITHKDTQTNLLGENPTKEQVEAASVELNVTGDYPDTYVWCGGADTLVPPKNTELMVEALSKNNIPHKFNIYEGIDHGVGLAFGTNAEGWIDNAVEFWEGR